MSTPEETTEREKAEDALFDMIENTEDPCKQWELAVWLVSLLPEKAVKDLAARRDDSQADAPRPWAIELRDHPGEPVFWNNQDGWGDAENADRFTDAERQTLNLPIDGAWVRMEGESK